MRRVSHCSRGRVDVSPGPRPQTAEGCPGRWIHRPTTTTRCNSSHRSDTRRRCSTPRQRLDGVAGHGCRRDPLDGCCVRRPSTSCGIGKPNLGPRAELAGSSSADLAESEPESVAEEPGARAARPAIRQRHARRSTGVLTDGRATSAFDRCTNSLPLAGLSRLPRDAGARRTGPISHTAAVGPCGSSSPEKTTNLIDETHPRRLMREDQVILALECHEARAGNPSRQHQAMLEGHPSVPATVQHESWDGDSRQQPRDVDVSEDV